MESSDHHQPSYLKQARKIHYKPATTTPTTTTTEAYVMTQKIEFEDLVKVLVKVLNTSTFLDAYNHHMTTTTTQSAHPIIYHQPQPINSYKTVTQKPQPIISYHPITKKPQSIISYQPATQ